MKKLIKFDDGNALFRNAKDTQNYKELEVYKKANILIQNSFIHIKNQWSERNTVKCYREKISYIKIECRVEPVKLLYYLSFR